MQSTKIYIKNHKSLNMSNPGLHTSWGTGHAWLVCKWLPPCCCSKPLFLYWLIVQRARSPNSCLLTHFPRGPYRRSRNAHTPATKRMASYNVRKTHPPNENKGMNGVQTFFLKFNICKWDRWNDENSGQYLSHQLTLLILDLLMKRQQSFC